MSANLTPSTDERFKQLEQRIADTQTALRLQSERVEELLKLMSQPVPTNALAIPEGSATDSGPAPSFVSRRSMLRNAALATLGAAAVWETMPSAMATEGGNLILGGSSSTNSCTSSTYLTTTSGYGLNIKTPGTGILSTSTGNCGVIGASTTNNGVWGQSSSHAGTYGTSTSGYGVYGKSAGSAAVYGKNTASPTASAGDGVAGTTNTENGFGVRGTNTQTGGGGVGGFSTAASGGAGVYGSSVSSGPGVYGISTGGCGLEGKGTTYGAILTGAGAPLYLAPGTISDPNSDTNPHGAGELYVDDFRELWYCAVEGTPGLWRKVAGSTTAGSLALLPGPTRFIDTRTAAESLSSTPGVTAPPPGSVVMPYTFTGTGALTPYEPMGTTAPVIPFGATSLFGRVTVLSGENGHTAVKGALQVSNANPPAFGSGLISWSSTPAVQSTTFLLPLDNSSGTSGKLYFVNTSVADDIDILVDISGYYY